MLRRSFVMMIVCCLLLLNLLSKVNGQSEPYPSNPPHNCPNFALCMPIVNWNQTTLNCPTSCVCQPGTTGPNCEVIDQCASNPCGSDKFNCTTGINSYQCNCLAGFTGEKCDIPITSICADNPCQNLGTCSSTDGTKYTCKCPAGYLAPNCQYKDPCASNPCGSNGKCSILFNGATFYCTCNFDYIGRKCESRKTTWKADSEEVAACLDYDSIIEDSSKFKKFTDSAMSVSKCADILENYLDDKIIYTRFVVMEKNCYLTTGNYVSGTDHFKDKLKDLDCNKMCPDWKTGEVCGTNNKRIIIGIDNKTTTVNDTCSIMPGSTCLSNTGNGKCISQTAFPGYQCACQPPYMLNSTSTGCDPPTDPCAVNPCQHNGTCIAADDYSSFKCDCTGRWQGDKCQYRMACIPNPCKYGGTCEDKMNGDYVCHCLYYYHEKNCTEINACEYSNPCVHGQCQNQGTGIMVKPVCKCDKGYNGAKCDKEINYCTVNEPCQYNGTCTPSFMDYKCDCVPGTEGKNCEKIIDNCVTYKDENGQLYPNRCQTRDKDAKCINEINSFTCNCSSQWTGQYCEMKVMITLFGKVNYQLLPLLNNLLLTPAAISSMVPFILGTLNETTRIGLSWTFEDMFDWTTYEEKELNSTRDFLQWNDVVLGNCFTFNHRQLNQSYKYRGSKIEGGFKAKMKINQEEYQPWTDTAAIMVFIHNKEDYIFSESIRYNAEPNSEIMMYTYGTVFTRLGGQYERCVKTPNEVKSYYYPGKYTADGCYRSCYQDLVKQNCDCIDPRYPGPADTVSCKCPALMTYQKNSETRRLGPSVSVLYHTANCLNPANNAPDQNCQMKIADSLLINVAIPEKTYSLYEETPRMDLNKFIGYLGGLLGVLMGIGAITFIEFFVMLFRLGCITCCYKKTIN